MIVTIVSILNVAICGLHLLPPIRKNSSLNIVISQDKEWGASLPQRRIHGIFGWFLCSQTGCVQEKAHEIDCTCEWWCFATFLIENLLCSFLCTVRALDVDPELVAAGGWPDWINLDAGMLQMLTTPYCIY